jgi:hypothetical protein
MVPQIIIDLGDKFSSVTNNNEKFNYQLRLEQIRDYCSMVLDQEQKKIKNTAFKPKRK